MARAFVRSVRVDSGVGMGETGGVFAPGAVRDRLAGALKVAFAEGLLSEQTLSYRLGLVFGRRLVDPAGVIGDLTTRARQRGRRPSSLTATVAVRRRERRRVPAAAGAPLVLALDWAGGEEELVIGRAPGCEVTLSNDSVSRRHARLLCRGGAWVIQDLGSTNGTIVNGMAVGRCQLRPGDRLELGDQLLDVD
jgi:hypothetical protein